MNFINRIFLPLLCCPIGALLMSPASAARDTGQAIWKQFTAAADERSGTSGTINLHLQWEIPKRRIVMLARLDDEQAVLYQIDSRADRTPSDSTGRVKCHVESNQLFCAGIGETAASLVAASGTNIWSALEAHASHQIQELNARTAESIQSQLNYAPAPRFDLTKQLHPFEWGGEYETVENAQAFLEAVTASPRIFLSSWPKVPRLGSNGSGWLNENDQLLMRATGRCAMLATSERTAVHHNIDFGMSSVVTREAKYLWQQPIQWKDLNGIEIDSTSVFMHGTYTAQFRSQGLTYLSGWNPRGVTINASKFDPSKYSVADWNIQLLLPEEGGLRERVMYAVTFLHLACSKG